MGVNFFKISVVYFVIAILLGMYMGIVDNFDLAPVHAHLNLLGWVSMALFAAFYHFYPDAGKTTLAKTHFWCHNLGVPVFQGALAIGILTGNETVAIITIIGSVVTILGGILFAVNVFKNI